MQTPGARRRRGVSSRSGRFEGDYVREPSLGGTTERDLLSLDPAKIDNGLQLVAKVLSPEIGPIIVNRRNDRY
jgi:hypothetical protein